MKLQCGVYGVGTVFFVEIESDADVEALQKAIVNERKDANDHFKVDPDTVTLYLARKKNNASICFDAVGAEIGWNWLKDDDDLDATLRDVARPYKKMRPSWKLNKTGYFGNVELGEQNIHILVELPTQDAAPNVKAPPLPPTSLHRHPERLKRRASIIAQGIIELCTDCLFPEFP